MRVFATKEFARFARKERLGSSQLCEAVRRSESGLIDADLGGGVIKQRVARQGQGRSGGYRTIIAFRSGDRSVFMYGFAKNRKANLSDDELEVYRRLASVFLNADAAAIQRLVDASELKEVECDGQEDA